MPKCGMTKKTQQMRIRSPHVLMRNVDPVLPYPLIALNRELFVYRNGQIHANVMIKRPAVLL